MIDCQRSVIEEAISKSGLDTSTVSKIIGKNHDYIRQYIERGTPRKLPNKIALKLSCILNTDLVSAFYEDVDQLAVWLTNNERIFIERYRKLTVNQKLEVSKILKEWSSLEF